MADLSDNPRVALLEALAVTAELTGTELSETAARVMAADLATYPVQQVLAALTRCRREIKGRLSIAAIIERIDDGRPGPNEAWAMIPQDEAGSTMMTDEMAQAFGVAAPLLRAGQSIPARMAFIESYASLVAKARAAHQAPKWFFSAGQDPSTRRAVLDDAVRKGLITSELATKLAPPIEQSVNRLLANPRTEMPEHVRQQLRRFQLRIVRNSREE